MTRRDRPTCQRRGNTPRIGFESKIESFFPTNPQVVFGKAVEGKQIFYRTFTRV